MRIKVLTLFLFFMLSSYSLAATPIQPPLQGAQSGNWTWVENNGFPYYILLPYNYSPNFTYPVVLYLHGTGAQAPQSNGAPYQALPGYMNSTDVLGMGVNYRADYPAIVVAPQCQNSQIFVNDWGGTHIDSNLNDTIDMPCGDQAIATVQSVLKQYSANPNQVYITGYSMGGFGTNYLYLKNQSLFAGAIAVAGSISGQATVDQFETAFLKKPFWAFHGFDDTTVNKAWDEAMYTASQALGGVRKFDEIIVPGDQTSFPTLEVTAQEQAWGFGDNHANADSFAFAQTQAMDWLFSQNLKGGTPPTETVIQRSAPVTTKATSGSSFQITYRFNAVPLGPGDSNDIVFVHFTNDQGDWAFGADHLPPVATGIWSGEIKDLQTVSIPPTLPSGTYSIHVGVYNPQTGVKVPLKAGYNVVPEGTDGYQVGTLLVP